MPIIISSESIITESIISENIISYFKILSWEEIKIRYIIKRLFGPREEAFENEITSVILIRETKPIINKSKLLTILKDQYALKDTIKIKSKKNLVYLTYNNIKCEITSVLSPYENPILEEACNNSHHWKDASTELQDTKSYYTIRVANSTCDAPAEHVGFKNVVLENNIFLTKIASALTELSPAAGVFWISSSLIIKGSDFSSIGKKTLGPSLPIELWVNFSIERSIHYKYSLVTRGLEAFANKEIEIRDRKENSQELAVFAFNLVYFLIENNIKLSDGIKLMGDNNKLITLVEGKSMFDKTKSVYILQY